MLSIKAAYRVRPNWISDAIYPVITFLFLPLSNPLFSCFTKIVFGKRTLDPNIRRKYVALKILAVFIEVKRILIRQKEEHHDIEKYDGYNTIKSVNAIFIISRRSAV